LKLQDEKDQLELRQAVNKLKVNSVNIGGSFFKYRLPEEISVAKESVNIQLLTEVPVVDPSSSKSARRLTERDAGWKRAALHRRLLSSSIKK
jgi:hypothetical protein